jgi:hypothetical protein
MSPLVITPPHSAHDLCLSVQIMIKTRINALLGDPSDPSHRAEIDTEVIPRGTTVPFKADPKLASSAGPRPGMKDAFVSEKYQPGPPAQDGHPPSHKEEKASGSLEELKEKLKDDHRQGLNQLKSSLQSNRALQIGRCQQLLREQQQVFSSVSVSATLSFGPQTDENDDQSLAVLKETLSYQEKGMINGYKQRCISETKTIKRKLHEGVDDLNLDDEEKKIIAQAAVKSLRDK